MRASAPVVAAAFALLVSSSMSSCITMNTPDNAYPSDVPWCENTGKVHDADVDDSAAVVDDAPMRAEIAKVWPLLGPKRGLLHLGVDERGRLTCMAVEQSTGDHRVDRAAARGMTKLKMTPATKAGAPVASTLHVVIRGYNGTDEEACADGLAWACHAAADKAATEKRWADADRLLDRACASGELPACTHLASLITSGTGAATTTTPDWTRAHRVLGPACDGKIGEACAMLGEMFERGQGVAVDVKKARELYETACFAGVNGRGCNALGILYALGLGVERDQEHALALYEEACARGSRIACANAGGRYFDGRAVRRDVVRGRALLDNACRRGEGVACTVIAERLHDSSEDAEAMRFVARGCELGNDNACVDQLAWHAQGLAVAAPARAGDDVARSLDRACRLDDNAEECMFEATLFRCGYGVAADAAHADELTTLACGRAARRGCVALADAARRAGDVARAHELNTLACDADIGSGCANLADAESDAQKALAFAERACVNGSCRALASRLFDTDATRAQALDTEACEQGFGDACADLADYVAKHGGDDDSAGAARISAWYRRGCDAYSSRSCRALAERYRAGHGVIKNDAKADALVARAGWIVGDVNGCRLAPP
jgi:TPR repeat protein